MNAFLTFIRLFLLAGLLAALLIPALVSRRTAAQGGGTAGMLDDNMIHLPPNYTTFIPPALGGVFTDGAYGTTITRLSNGLTQFPPGGDGVHHEYAVMSPFNADNTLILIAAHTKGFYVVNRSGQIVVQPADVNIGHQDEPRWSATNPNVFYFHETNGTLKNRIMKYDIAAPLAQRKTVVRTFNGTGCPAGTNCPNFTSINFGKGESDISEDGDHLVIIGNSPSVSGTENTTGLYTFSTNTLSATAVLNNRGGVDHCDVTPNNNVICRWVTNGTGRYRGYELFNQNMTFVRQVMPWGAHADRGRDANGDEVLLIAAYNDLTPPAGCENNGVEKIKLSDASKTCLVGLGWASEIHVSANSLRVNGVNTNPWLLVSYSDTGNGTTNPNASLPANWQSLWGLRYNEVLLIKIDGTERRRLLHHRTRKVGSDTYWFTPRAALSRDGRYALFDSNPQAVAAPDDYTDVYLADLPPSCAAASITTHPANQTVCAGANVTFSVTASGAGLTYQWRRNGTNISGATGSSYSINGATTANAGSYDVIVSAACGPAVTSTAATLTVNAPPAITTQPASLTRAEGQSAAFSVTATGAGLTYQWRKNGTNISGATGSSYTIAAVAASDAGSYSVVVSGACNPAATSTAATLTVAQALTLSVANAASYNSAEFAVESVIAAFGRKFANLLLGAASAPLPTVLGGTSVNVRDRNNVDRSAGLYFIAPDRLNFLLPPGTATGAATVTINSPLGVSQNTITVAAVAPGLFSADSSGTGLMKGYALRTVGATQTVEQVARFDPATRRWVAVPVAPPLNQVALVLLGTGFRNRAALPTVTIGGTAATVLSAGASSTTIGFDELRVQLPALTSGSKNIVVTVDGKAANVVTVQIQ